MRQIAIALVAVTLLAASAVADEASVVPTVDYHAALINQYHLSSTRFASASHSLYVLRSGVPVINAWAALVYFWPEIFLGVSFIAAVISYRRLRHHLRACMAVTEPFCRACNYQLTGLTSTRCPECGTNITGVNRGTYRRRTGRITFHATVLAVAAIVPLVSYGYGHRKPALAEWLDWPSDSFTDVVERYHIGVLKRLEIVTPDCDLLDEIDANDGSLRRHILRCRNLDNSDAPALSPDEHYVYLHGETWVKQFRISNGDLVRRYDMSPADASPGGCQISSDGRLLFAYWNPAKGGIGGLCIFDTVRGTALPSVNDPSLNYVEPFQGGYILSIGPELQIYRNNGALVATGQSEAPIDTIDDATFTRDGRYMYVVKGTNIGNTLHNTNRIEKWDIEKALRVQTILCPYLVYNVTLSPDERFLLSTAQTNPAVHPFDLLDIRSATDGRLLQHLAIPNMDAFFYALFSSDGKRMIVMGSDDTGERILILDTAKALPK